MPVADAAVAAGPPLVPDVYRVAGTRRETVDTWTLTLAGPPLPFAPGQFTMLYAFGTGEVPISISGDPARPERLVQTVRSVGPATRAICALRPGDALGARGPFGSAWPVEAATGGDLVLVAGGIGLAPLRPALAAVLARRDAYRRVLLLYGGRSPEELLYHDGLERWGVDSRLDLAVTVDRADAGWRGPVGVVTQLVERARLDPARTTALVCGPEPMMRFTAKALLARGISPERLHLSLERNMKCALGHCGRCQLGATLVCRDGPVLPYPVAAPLLEVKEL